MDHPSRERSTTEAGRESKYYTMILIVEIYFLLTTLVT